MKKKDFTLSDIYVADFETRAGENAIKEQKTWVWAWAICNLENYEDVTTGNTISSFKDLISKPGDKLIYFHNLKFDGIFIMDYLLKNGFRFTHKRKLEIKEFSILMDGQKKLFQIKVRFSKRCLVEFRDSYKKIPSSVSAIADGFKTKYKKTEIDYELDRPEDYVMTEEEIEYIANDVRVVAEALRHMYSEGYDGLTIGSDALKKFKSIFGDNGKNSKFRNIFPVLEKDEDSFVRKAYKGGWTYCRPDKTGRHKNIYHYDVCSLYPSNMSEIEYELCGNLYKNIYPYQAGQYYKGKFNEKYAYKYPLYIQHFKAVFTLKDGYLPTVQLKGNYMFGNTEYVTDSKGEQELYMTNIDLELFFEHYDVLAIQYIDGYAYRAASGFFDNYINHFIEIKNSETGAKRQIAKLFLNNLYGKFASSMDVTSVAPVLDEDGDKIRFEVFEHSEKEPVYAPVGAFITAYSRRFTIKTAQANYENFIYSDTDSLFLTKQLEYGEVHGKKLYTWTCESAEEENGCYTDVIFLGSKRYAKKVGKDWKIVCAGMGKDAVKKFIDNIKTDMMSIDDFKIGLKLENCNLKAKTVSGGVVLVSNGFELK